MWGSSALNVQITLDGNWAIPFTLTFGGRDMRLRPYGACEDVVTDL
jgi:hypothetical protein